MFLLGFRLEWPTLVLHIRYPLTRSRNFDSNSNYIFLFPFTLIPLYFYILSQTNPFPYQIDPKRRNLFDDKTRERVKKQESWYLLFQYHQTLPLPEFLRAISYLTNRKNQTRTNSDYIWYCNSPSVRCEIYTAALVCPSTFELTIYQRHSSARTINKYKKKKYRIYVYSV